MECVKSVIVFLKLNLSEMWLRRSEGAWIAMLLLMKLLKNRNSVRLRRSERLRLIQINMLNHDWVLFFRSTWVISFQRSSVDANRKKIMIDQELDGHESQGNSKRTLIRVERTNLAVCDVVDEFVEFRVKAKKQLPREWILSTQPHNTPSRDDWNEGTEATTDWTLAKQRPTRQRIWTRLQMLRKNRNKNL